LTGEKKLRFYYLNGYYHGNYLEWYGNGILKIKSTYKDRVLDGIYKEYFKNGILKIHTNFSKGFLKF
jgi:antitoxin component YwqK of YwqJK toxin-antitoxin module